MKMAKAPQEPTLFSDTDPVAEGKGRIRPRARLLRTIGAELISSEIVAVIELVRNSYDADATLVRLVFDQPENPDSATLEIRDNGHGMSREILLGPWLEPATDHKSEVGDGETGGTESPRGRRRLGSKGVGRFAAQRLGAKLKLRTRAEGSITELSAWFDWTALEEGKYLDEVRIPWREHHPVHIEGHGTHLRILDLRNRWTPDRFDKLKLGLSRLISPTIEEEFRIEITINGAPERIRPAVDLEQAMYAVAGEVTEGGRCRIRYTDLNGDAEEWERTVLWPGASEETCGPFSFRIAAWDLDSPALNHFLKLTRKDIGLRDFRRIIRDHSGIALYRDSFRILPYGEPDNDWLRLDRRRVNNPTMRLSNNQILGTIQLSADENSHLQDQTNREGLVTNEAYAHLQEVVLELLGYLETRRFAARRAMDIDWQRRTSKLPSLEAADGGELDGLLSGIRTGNGTTKDDIETIKRAFTEIREASADTVRHYAGLATSGQLSGLVFRQLMHPIRQARSELDLALEEAERPAPSVDDLEDLQSSLKSALQHLRTMEKRIEKLDPLALGGRGRRVSDIELGATLQDVLEAFEDEFDRYAVALDFQAEPEVTVRSNREIAQQVLANLLENALFWAPQGGARIPVVTVRLTSRGFSISDTGPGIPERLRPVIFDPHFTTRDGAHGLGLTLAKDLLKGVGGRIRLSEPQCARFTVELHHD